MPTNLKIHITSHIVYHVTKYRQKDTNFMQKDACSLLDQLMRDHASCCGICRDAFLQ
jgi:hypothetical protein